ncbi:MAG: hypothetical protein ACXQS8_03310 [Candidatus Helarchaeales archaeon]
MPMQKAVYHRQRQCQDQEPLLPNNREELEKKLAISFLNLEKLRIKTPFPLRECLLPDKVNPSPSVRHPIRFLVS